MILLKILMFTTIFSLVIVIPIFVAEYLSYSITLTSRRFLTPGLLGDQSLLGKKTAVKHKGLAT